MRIGLVTLDKTGCLRLFNSAAEQILGYVAQEVRGKPCDTIFNGSAELLAGLRTRPRGDRQEMTLKMSARHKDGREMPLVVTAHVATESDASSRPGNGEIILVLEDAQELDRLENQLRHLNKLQSLDHFAAGIVHEIRNPLAGISTNAQYMKENIGPKERFREEIEDILADVKNIEEVTSRVLDFAHPNKSYVREMPVEHIIEEVIRISKMPLRRQGIRLLTSFDKSQTKVRVDVSQIKQVIFNMIRNACEAMPDGGELRIHTNRLAAGHANGQVRVEIEDSGRGIAEEHLERIFDPFFTLNREGTGLGLAISRRIIESHGGRIEVKSKLGKGTTFGIVLPAA